MINLSKNYLLNYQSILHSDRHWYFVLSSPLSASRFQ